VLILIDRAKEMTALAISPKKYVVESIKPFITASQRSTIATICQQKTIKFFLRFKLLESLVELFIKLKLVHV
jgi:hypothetical protein